MTPSPVAALLDVLRERRDAGDEFGDAWPIAVQAALADVHARDELKQWRHALNGTAAAWRCSYEHRPLDRRERALSLVGDPADREPVASTRACAHCGGPMPEDAPRNARHCSKSCRDKTSYVRRGAVKNARMRELRRQRMAA